MKKYSIVETNAKGNAFKVKFMTSDTQKAQRILSDFRNENPDTEFHLLACED